MSSFEVDQTTYPKARAYPLRHGYQARGTRPTSIVVHSTEGKKGQTLQSAATYLYTSAAVSAHYLVGRAGELIEFLDPRKYQAWHAGAAQAAYSNARSIGIECLHAEGETWPKAQKDALAWLLHDLATDYDIPSTLIDTHGQIAIPGPYKRKHDPTDWEREAFRLFAHAAVTAPLARLWRVVDPSGVNVREGPGANTPKIAPALPQGTLFHGSPVQGAAVGTNNVWVARLPSEGGGHMWSGALEEVK